MVSYKINPMGNKLANYNFNRCFSLGQMVKKLKESGLMEFSMVNAQSQKQMEHRR